MIFKRIQLFFLFLIFSGLFLFTGSATAQQNPDSKWIINAPFEHNVFIENNGQFIQDIKDSIVQPIMYFTQKGKLSVYFTNQGLTFEYDSIYLNTETSGDGDDDEKVRVLPVYMHIHWDGANRDTKVEVQNSVNNYFTYPNPNDHSGKSSIKAHAWEKIIYRNLYQGIDVEFYYPKNKQGLEYAIIVHPGADLSKVKMHYSGNAKVSLNENNLNILSPCANFTDQAPVTKTGDGDEVKSNFLVNNNIVSFETSAYENNKTLIIDPILSTTSFTGTNKAYNLEYDLAGNIYVMGGGDATEFQLQKYNAAGTLQWTFTSTFAYTFHAKYYYGGFTTDNRSGSSYIAEGLDFSGGGCKVEKVNAAGALVTTYPGINTMDEVWAIAYDYCDNQLILGTGEGTSGSVNAGAIMDTSCTTSTGVNVLNAPNGDSHHDMCMIAFDGVGKCYMATTTPASNTYRGQGFLNVMLQMPSATLAPTAYQVFDRSAFIETASIPYYPALLSAPYLYCGNEFNGLAADLNMVITYDGAKIRKWTPATGVIIDSVTVTANPQMWGGIALDCQDNIYVGEQTSFSIYNSALGLVSTTAIGAGDTVYDLKLSPDNIVYTCGNGFIAKNPVVIPKMVTASAIAATGCTCNGTATVNSVCDNYPFTYNWSNGQTTQTISGLCPGSYTVTVIDAACIPRSDTAILNVTGSGGSLTVTSTSVNINCFGVNNGSANATVTGGTAPYTYSWAPSGQTNANATGLSAGTYTVTVTDANGCTGSVVITITQPTALVVNTSVVSANCNQNNGSATATITGGTGIYTYSWSPGGNSSSTATGLSAASYTITVTDANGCTQTATVAVTNNGGATLTIGAIVNLSCFGDTNGSATVNVAGGTAPFTYSWSPTAQTNSTATGLSAGTYTISVTDANGCITIDTAIITQPTALNINTTTVSSNCNLSNGSATATVTGGTGPYTYSWSSGGNTNATATALSAATYTIYITDNNGCTQTATASVSNLNGITTSIGATTNVSCFNGTNGSATVNVAGGTGPYTYVWTPAGGANSSATGLSAGTYTVTVTDANGCVSIITDTITQPTQLIASMGLPVNVSCNGGSNGSAALTITGGTAPYSYLWTPSGQTNATATGLSVGTYNVNITDNNGCIVASTITITEPVLLTAGITALTNVSCNGGRNGSLTVTGAGGTPAYKYAWTPSGGTNSSATGLSVGNYTVTITDANGCTASATDLITEPTPIIIVTTNQTICSGQTTTLAANVTGGTGAYTYNWMPGGGTGQNIMVSPAVTTVYTITVTDANGCSVTSAASVFITQIPSLVVSSYTSICAGNPVTLTATGYGGAYTWQPGNLSGPTITVTPSVTTTYTISLVTPCGTQTDTVTVNVSPMPMVSFTSDIRQGCYPLCIQFRDLSSGPITQWSWLFGNGDSSKDENPVYCYPNPGDYTVILNVTTNIGCSSTLKILNMIDVYAHPVAAFTYSPDPVNIFDATVQFTDKSTDPYGISYWWWNFGTGNDFSVESSLENPTYTYSDTGLYCAKLEVMDIHGCIDSTIQCISIGPVPTLYIPSAFSPNGDGLNETFMAKGSYIKTFEMNIYDRWGMKLYHANDINNGWDGKLNGVTCQEDTYVYLIKVTDVIGNEHNYIGNVILIK